MNGKMSHKKLKVLLDKARAASDAEDYDEAIRLYTEGRKVIYVDMDNTLVDFQSGIDALDAKTRQAYEDRYHAVPGIFALMKLLPDALKAFRTLAKQHDVYILSTAPWSNSSAWSDKLHWVKKHLKGSAYKRLILTHHKELLSGDYLIDDSPRNGAENFRGKWIPFGSAEFPDWEAVLDFLRLCEEM
jgi:5'(3')-deoxyribonucleotidase